MIIKPMIATIEELRQEYVCNVASNWIKEGLTINNARKQLSCLLTHRLNDNTSDTDEVNISILERVINTLTK